MLETRARDTPHRSVRIALVHYSFLPVIGGVELVIAAQAALFAEAGHSVTILCGRGGAWLGEKQEGPRPPTVRVLPELDGSSKQGQAAQQEVVTRGAGEAFKLARAAARDALRSCLREHQLVIVHNILTMHFHLALTAALWDLADELAQVRFIGWVHDLALCNPDYQLPPTSRAPWELLAQAHPRCTYVAVSPLRAGQFVKLTNQPGTRCRAIANGVNPSPDLPAQVGALDVQHGLGRRDFLLLQPARVLHRKNIEFTLDVIAAIKTSGHSCAALITAPAEIHHPGSAEYEAQLRERRDALGLGEDAFFLSESAPLSSAEVRSLFGFADALFFPSRQEGFGIPVLEAALHRLPIFCADLEPLNGLLSSAVTTFPVNAQPSAVAELVVRKLQADPAFRARKETLRNYTWAAIYQNALAPLLAETNLA